MFCYYSNFLNLKSDKETTYLKSDVDEKLNLKANWTDILTTSQIYTLLQLKSNQATTYTIIQVDEKLNLKSNITDVYNKIYLYTKDELNALLINKVHLNTLSL